MMQTEITINLDGLGVYKVENDLEHDEWYEFTARFRGSDDGTAEFDAVCLRQLAKPKRKV